MRKIAVIISTLGHPLLTFPLFILIVMFSCEPFVKAIQVSFLIIGCFLIPVIRWMYTKSKKGITTNFDVSEKRQRRSLFSFAAPLLLVVTIILFLTHQTKNVCLSSLFALILLLVSQGTNYFIKSSLHVSLNIYLAALCFTLDDRLGIIVFLFTGLLGWSRIKLGRHTLEEVVAGMIIGIVISLMMLVVEGYL